jgi:murein DD-endopeptidase MepM/ murein hydrolase activator NlpD
MAYADHEPLATEIVQRLTGTTAGCEPLSTGPWIPPVQVGYTLTSSYGWRPSPTRGGTELHTGQDFARAEGSPVTAVSRGIVVHTGWRAATATWSGSGTRAVSSPGTPTSPPFTSEKARAYEPVIGSGR